MGGSVVQYYLIQEICGYFFLLLGGYLSFFILMLKCGAAPLHFWIFSVVGALRGFVLVWFLTVQKLPYFFVMVGFCSGLFFYFLFMGAVFCYFQFFFLRYWSNMVLVVSTESFNWLLLLSVFVSRRVFFLSFIYYLVILLIIGFSSGVKNNYLGWEMVIIFFNVPFCVTFLLKILVLVFSLGFNYFFLVFLFFMPLISLGVTFWFMYLMFSDLNLGLKGFMGFFLFPFMLLGFF